MPLLSRESPCIGFCSTVYGDDVCRGCNRYFEEVIHWQSLNTEDKEAATQRIHTFIRQAVGEYLTVTHPELLDAQLKKHQVPLPEIDSPEARVLALLFAGAAQMLDLSAYGLKATEKAENKSALEIKIAIIQRRLELAQPEYKNWKIQTQTNWHF